MITVFSEKTVYFVETAAFNAIFVVGLEEPSFRAP
jgi:hypothetical protein